ncbi:MAG: M1 family aminopeptidase [Bacteroidota bacterium]
MKQINNILILSLCLSFTLSAQQPQFIEQLQQIAKSEMQANAGKIFSASTITINDYDVKYYRCQWQVNPAVKFISGAITTYFNPLVSAFDTIRFNMSDSLSVDSVKYHQALILFNHPIGNILVVSLSAVIPQNILDSITVYYHGKPASTGFGSFIQSTHGSGVPVIWTLSEPFGASDWWPCKNGLTDKADSIDIIVTTPSAYRVASNGVLVSEILNGANKIYHWKHRYPIATYLICFAVTNYARYSDWVPFGNDPPLEVLNYVYPEDSATAVVQSPGVIPVMQLFDTLFGMYPFQKEKYGHAQFGWGGGMEHQTMTFLTNFSHGLVAHELSHQWVGDKITCGRWEDIWLNEGFATYFTSLTYEHMFGGIYWMAQKEQQINYITSQPDGSVWCNDTTNEYRIFDSRLSYTKGGMILHQLRWVIGDKAFFSAINNYLNDPLLAYRFAKTTDAKKHFETTSKQDLTWYFNDWFTGQGYPSYQINWEQTGNTVNLTINQTQSHPSVSFFELPVPIKFLNSTRDTDTIVVFNHTASGQSFSAVIPFIVDSVEFDPNYWIISADNISTNIKEQNILEEYIKVYPNPAQENITIKIGNKATSSTMEITDITGRIILRSADLCSCENIIDIKNLSHGFYLLNIYSETKKSIIKFVK